MTEESSYMKQVQGAQALFEAGLRHQAAVRLARAGFTSLEKIAAATRDDLLAVNGVSLATVQDCERLIGRTLPWPSRYWLDKGLSPRLAKLFVKSGIDSLDALGRKSLKDMRSLHLGWGSIRQCEVLLGRFFWAD